MASACMHACMPVSMYDDDDDDDDVCVWTYPGLQECRWRKTRMM